VPGAPRLVTGGKDGRAYLIDTNNLGHMGNDSQIPQRWTAVSSTPRPNDTHQAGRGKDHPVDNDCVKLTYTGWNRDGTMVSSSRLQGDAVVQCIRKTIQGVADALKEMVAGEERRLWVPAGLTFKADDDDPRPPNVDLTFDVELVDIIKAPATPADLKAPPGTATKLPSGLVMKVVKKGTGTLRSSPTSRVRFHCSGWTADGTLVESTQMAGQSAVFFVEDTIAGWREGLRRMLVGEKARLWIPADLAYGEKPRRRGVPAGKLVYDIELLAIEN
jgi:FKBP-type peptidyl-prolyl cis-trans isomerase